MFLLNIFTVHGTFWSKRSGTCLLFLLKKVVKIIAQLTLLIQAGSDQCIKFPPPTLAIVMPGASFVLLHFIMVSVEGYKEDWSMGWISNKDLFFFLVGLNRDTLRISYSLSQDWPKTSQSLKFPGDVPAFFFPLHGLEKEEGLEQKRLNKSRFVG